MEPARIHRDINYNFEIASNILIIIHQNPDGDAIGSGLSLVNFLKKTGKQVSIFCRNTPSAQFDFLLDLEIIKSDPFIFQKNPDLIIVVDSGDLHYAGVKEHIGQLSQPKSFLINIDHHYTNQLFGDLNLVNPAASSTAEVIYNFFDDLRIDIDKDIATYLLTGILMDTNAFTNPATNMASLAAASQLLIKGADLKKIVTHALKNKKLSTLKLWGKALTRLKKDKKTGFVTTIITQKDIMECQADEEATEGVSNFLSNLSDTKAVMVLLELADGKIKGSLRSNNDLIDVAKIATIMGGGGHKKAAGFTITGKLKETANGWQVV